MKQEMMGWQWHQLDHMEIICTSLQTDNYASTSSLNCLQAKCSSLRLNSSLQALKASVVYRNLDREEFIKVFTYFCTKLIETTVFVFFFVKYISCFCCFLLINCHCYEKGHAGSNTVLQQTPPFLHWQCQLTQVDLYNGRKTIAIVTAVAYELFVCCADYLLIAVYIS